MKRTLAITVVAFALSVAGPFSFASNIAFDSAADAVYNGGWSTGLNGGTGFGQWFLNVADDGDAVVNGGHFVGNSIGNGDGVDDGNVGGLPGDGDINTPATDSGRAWGMWAHTGDTSEAFRSFTGGALSVGQTFTIDMDNGFVNGTVGLALQNAAGENLWEFLYTAAQYDINDASGGTPTAIGYTDEGLNLSFTLTAPTTYSVAITTRGGATQTVPGTLMAAGSGQNIDQIRLFNFNAGNGSQHDDFANSMAVIPEPSSMALFGAAVVGLLALRRRRG